MCPSPCSYLPLGFRSIHLGYVEDVDVKGIPAYRFAPPHDVLQSPEENPTNAGFCVPAGDCLGTGVLKVSVCREGKRWLITVTTLVGIKYVPHIHTVCFD